MASPISSSSGRAPSPAGSTADDGFRPDIEGMRAVAVVLVLLYHAGVPGINGGFIGVDVFFVVSGFLITGLILRELDRTGTAALLVLAVTVAISAVFLPPLRVPDISADAAAAALYVSNLRFAFQSTDYLASELAPSPILHYWSLGVEEQFYLFWPALLLAISIFRPRSIRPIAIAVGTVTVVSLAFAIWLTGVAGPWAFFSLPARAWELGLGALVTIGAARLATLPRTWASPISAAGLLLVLIGAVVITTDTPFPGTAAILPVVGAALVLAGGTVSTESPVARALSTRPMRFLGRISYSLYLWHWPILVLPAAALETDLPLIVRVALALLTIPIAAASQRWVEDPIRHGRFVGFRPTRNLAFAGALSLTVALASTAIGLGLVPGTATASLASEDGGPSTDPGLEPLGTPEPSVRVGGSAAPATPPVTEVSATVGGPVPSNLRPSLRRRALR